MKIIEKEPTKRKAFAIIVAGIGLAFAAAVVLHYGLNVSNFMTLFSETALNGYMNVWAFADLSLHPLVVLIGTILAAVLFVLGLIAIIVKKKPIYLLGLFFGLIGAGCAGYVHLATYGDQLLLVDILSYLALGFSLLGLILTVIFAFLPREVTVSAEEEVPVINEKKEEPAEEKKPDEPKKEEKKIVEIVPAVEEDKSVMGEKPLEEEKKEEIPPVEEHVHEGVGGEGRGEKVAEAPAAKEAPAKKALGKYEIFPEAGFYKYRLKANNGEVLLVSSGYKTREGARNGIETLKRNVPEGVTKIITDKNGFSQFRIFTQNESRLIASGEYYATEMAATKSLASVQRFYLAEKIVDLESIPESDMREWKIELPPQNDLKNGKFEIFIEENSKKWQGRLVANNGALLFLTAVYASKNSVTNGFNNIKKKILAGEMTVARDKQNRYQFRIVSDNGSVILMGESYPSKDSAISAAISVRNFINLAKINDLSRGI